MRENLTLADLPPMNKDEKDWWDEHNSEYCHYFYRIDNIKNKMFYYGIHSERFDSGRAPEEDGYMGSGADLKKAQYEEGIENFKKTVIKTFSTRDEARLEEMKVVDKDLVNDPMCYNVVLGGGCVPSFLKPTEGLVAVNYRDSSIRKDKMFLITTEEYHKNKDKYITASSDLVIVNYRDAAKRTTSFFQVSREEYENNKEIYITSLNGRVIYKNKDDWDDVRSLSPNDPLVLSGQFVGINNGIRQSRETINKKLGERNGSYGSFWITNGKENKKIKDQEIPEGWKKGRTIVINSAGNKTVTPRFGSLYINRYTLERKYFTKDELEHVPKDLWFSKGFYKDNKFIEFEDIQSIFSRTNSWAKVSKELKVDIVTLRKIKRFYESKGKIFSSTAKIKKPREIGRWSSGMKNRVYIHDSFGNYKTIKKDDLDNYIKLGWKLGKKENR